MSEFGLPTHVDLDQIVDDLMRAYRVCHQTSTYCMDKGGELASLDRLKAFDDCAEISMTLANFLLRGSEHSMALAKASMAVAEACAVSIEDIEHGDPQLRTAYAVCQHARHACMQLLGEEVPEFEDRLDEAVRESFPASDPPPPPTQL